MPPEDFSRLPEANRPMLADANVMDGLFRKLAADVLRIKSGFSAGRPGFENAKDLLIEECRKYARIIAGDDPAFEPLPWSDSVRWQMRWVVRLAHDPDADELMDVHTDTETVGTAFLLIWAKVVMAASDSLASGAQTEAQVKAHLDEVRGHFVGTVLGLE
ncbi:hypothetical protein [Thiomonas sp.]|uniref:hypothetical protein n=1 Tax=Thiomonas sp. TaxID=2047785 RepID=UPI002622FDCD|nr:hypothetical protein [Thiomonas sp.]